VCLRSIFFFMNFASLFLRRLVVLQSEKREASTEPNRKSIPYFLCRVSALRDWVPDFELAVCCSLTRSFFTDSDFRLGLSFSMSDEPAAVSNSIASTFRVPRMATRF